MAMAGLSDFETASIVFESKSDSVVFDVNIDFDARTPGMPLDIVSALLKDEKHLPAHFGIKFHRTFRFTGVEAEFDLVGRKEITGEAAHALHKVAEIVAVG